MDAQAALPDDEETVASQQVVYPRDRAGGGVLDRQHAVVDLPVPQRGEDVLELGAGGPLPVLAEVVGERLLGEGARRAVVPYLPGQRGRLTRQRAADVPPLGRPADRHHRVHKPFRLGRIARVPQPRDRLIEHHALPVPLQDLHVPHLFKPRDLAHHVHPPLKERDQLGIDLVDLPPVACQILHKYLPAAFLKESLPKNF